MFPVWQLPSTIHPACRPHFIHKTCPSADNSELLLKLLGYQIVSECTLCSYHNCHKIYHTKLHYISASVLSNQIVG